ncbi:MAG: D-glycerate dehydrogenase [Candidatus Taylorbacteria bacterium]|nr:D-glycerate dehydrogenase [Candidatus Taylorbacteria bacterium]
MKKILVTREIHALGIDMLKAKGYEVDVASGDRPKTQKELIRLVKKKPYDAVVTILTDRIDKAVFDAAPQAKIFANYAVGYDNVDIAEAKRRGIVVTNTPGDYSGCVAEHAIALMLALTTRLVEADAFTRKGRFKGFAPLAFLGTDLRGKTLGLVGAGRIGELLARFASRGLDMKVLYSDVVRNAKIESEYGAVKASLDEVLRASDVVSLHVPLLPATEHLIDASKLSLMKKTAYLINTARGKVVDENALVRALKAGQIAGAGLDVFEFEPKLAAGLSKLRNVVLTPHIASSRESARSEMARIVASNVIDFLEGGQPLNIVNP